MKDLLTYIAQNLVEHPQAVDVQETETDGNVVLELRVDPSDMGKVIGPAGPDCQGNPHADALCGPAPGQKGFRRNYGLKNGGRFLRPPFFHGKGGRCLETPIFGSR